MADIDHFETRAAQERARLQLALGELRARSTTASVLPQISALAQAGGKALGRRTMIAARRNPLAFGLVGVGLGLMVTGTGARKGAQARHAEAGTVPTAAEMRAARTAGLEDLPAEDRLRVIAARDEAIAAQERLESRAVGAARKGSGVKALTVGALVLGAGAAVVALLPGRRGRDKDLWDDRDRRMADAAAAYAEAQASLPRTRTSAR